MEDVRKEVQYMWKDTITLGDRQKRGGEDRGMVKCVRVCVCVERGELD